MPSFKDDLDRLIAKVYKSENYSDYDKNLASFAGYTMDNYIIHTDQMTSDSLFREPEKVKRFVPPTFEQVDEYLKEINYHDPHFANIFVNHGIQTDWHLANGQKMKSWKGAIRTWIARKQERESR